MKIIQPYAKIMVLTPEPLRHIEWCARISHRSEDASPNTERFIKTVVMDHGDWSVVEHVTASVDAVMDRGITHEWVRHRLASYTQESTRFVNYEKKMPPAFIYPIPGVDCEYCRTGDEPTVSGIHHRPGFPLCQYNRDWLWIIQNCENMYCALLKKGWRPQEARSVFPNALASRIVTTANLRSWRHFFLMRTSKEAHPQMRQITIPLLKEFQQRIPLLYDDIVPESRQIDNLKLGR